ncbi:ABC transporter ATP-binding protein [Reyranella sp. CPCC 100927]|uniref:ABC transporter ATP-binding protein n=1 Tax=Reyranella sp. CPCC 100927 TaxID=2599616 RepID=UPI0011B72986|nr:ABC transporter ATP-binding protein [Reyranella sp. CPCC 100927]TWT11649.1 ABC transporter ATP-binding protein [Reyranella sp. CPCC 100927]
MPDANLPLSPPAVMLRDLHVSFTMPGKQINAVNGVDLLLRQGEVVALIGESGSGKSVTLRAIMRLLDERGTCMSGTLSVNGKDVLGMSSRALAAMRGKDVAMVFQEPLLALDPAYTIGNQIAETIRRHERITARDAAARALALFEKVCIPSPQRRLAAYPHELSGGMRQRAMIALALACHPKVLLADEPTTALDATVQIQILLLLRELQRDLGLSVIFVTHDIAAAVEVADRIAVMYAGRIVEEGSTRALISAPRHPYTIALLNSRRHAAEQRGTRLETIGGAPPDLAALPPGCAFAARCSRATDDCRAAQPLAFDVEPDHRVRCIHTGMTAATARI